MRAHSRRARAGSALREARVVLRRLPLIASLIVLAGTTVIAGSAVIAAEAGTPTEGTDSAAGIAATAPLASKALQLAAVKRSIAEADCDYAVDEPIIEACDQLQAQANMLREEIDALKGQAAKSAEQAAMQPPRTKLHNFAAHTRPDMSYRTFCVRECDGFYYPLSEAAAPGDFPADEAKCRASCLAPAKLFYIPAPGGDAGAMTALTGERYGDLANAFRYRSEYVPACTCKPMPWTAEAKAAFARRAVLATRTPSERIVAEGAGEVATLLASGEVKVAVRATNMKRRNNRAVVARTGGQLLLFRPFRIGFGLAALASAEPMPQRHVFRFRGRD